MNQCIYKISTETLSYFPKILLENSKVYLKTKVSSQYAH